MSSVSGLASDHVVDLRTLEEDVGVGNGLELTTKSSYWNDLLDCCVKIRQCWVPCLLNSIIHDCRVSCFRSLCTASVNGDRQCGAVFLASYLSPRAGFKAADSPSCTLTDLSCASCMITVLGCLEKFRYKKHRSQIACSSLYIFLLVGFLSSIRGHLLSLAIHSVLWE